MRSFHEDDALQRGRWLLRASRLTPWLALPLLVWMVLGLLQLRVDFSPQALFVQGSTDALEYEDFRARYGSDDHVVFVLVESDGPLTLAGFGALAALTDCMQRSASCPAPLHAPPGISDVQSLLTAPLVRSVTGEDGRQELRVEAPARPRTEEEAAALLAELRQSELWRRLLLSDDGQTSAVALRVDDDVHAIADVQPLVRDLRTRLQSLSEQHPSVRITPHGPPLTRVDVVQTMLQDQMLLVPLVGLFLVLALLLQFRTWSGVVLPLSTVVVGALFMLACIGHSGENISILSSILPPLILVIGVADAIHLLSRFSHEREQGLAHRDALVRTLQALGGACFLTSFTTAVGFGSLLLADLPILQSFGTHAALGVFGSFAGTMLLLPWLLDRFRIDPLVASVGGRRARRLLELLDRALLATLSLVLRAPRRIAVLLIIPIVVGVVAMSRLPVDNYIMEYVPADYPIHRAHAVLEEQLSGIVAIEILLTAPDDAEDEPWLEPEMLQRAAEIESWLRARPEIGNVTSLLPLLRELRGAVRGAEEARTLPQSRREAAFLQLLAEGADGPDGAPITDSFLRPPGDEIRLSARGKDWGARQFLVFRSELEAAIAQACEGSGVTAVVTGVSEVGYIGIDILIRDLLRSLAWAFAVIWVVLVLLLRDPKLASIAMVPNMAPVLTVLGAVWLSGGHLETISAMIFCIGLGIAVDDTIHYLTRFRELRRSGAGLRAALTDTTRTTGRALVFTTVVLLAGFGVMIISSFPPNQRFCLLGVGLIGWALVADLLLLPALLWLAYAGPTEEETCAP